MSRESPNTNLRSNVLRFSFSFPKTLRRLSLGFQILLHCTTLKNVFVVWLRVGTKTHRFEAKRVIATNGKKNRQTHNSHDEDKFSHEKMIRSSSSWRCERGGGGVVFENKTPRGSFCVRSVRRRGNVAPEHVAQPATPQLCLRARRAVCLRTRIEIIVAFSPQSCRRTAGFRGRDADASPRAAGGPKYPGEEGLGPHRNGRDADNDDALLLCCSPSTAGVIYWFATIDVSSVIVTTTGRAQMKGIRGKQFVWAISPGRARNGSFVFLRRHLGIRVSNARFAPSKSNKTLAHEVTTRNLCNECANNNHITSPESAFQLHLNQTGPT